MWNPNNENHRSRLLDALQDSRSKLKPHVDIHDRALRQYLGKMYNPNEESDKSEINLMEMAMNIFLRHILPKPPSATVITNRAQYRPAGRAFESVLENRLRIDGEIHKQWRLAAVSSMFSLGVVKVGIEQDEAIDQKGYTVYRDQPYIRNVMIRDWIHDMGAQSMEELRYMAHRYVRPLEEAMEDDTLERTEGIEARDNRQNMSVADNQTNLDSTRSKTDYVEMAEFWDVWLEQEKLLITFPGDLSASPKPLRIIEWEGPCCGPFHLLYHNTVDGKPFPLAPASMWIEPHYHVNELHDKTITQALRQKTIGVASGLDIDDAKAINESKDGDAVAVSMVAAMNEISFGGFDQKNYALEIGLKDLFSNLNGNLDLLGGGGPQSDTAAQDKILNANSGLRTQRMQETVLEFTAKSLRDYAYWLWTDPLNSYPYQLQLPGWEGDPPMGELTPQQRTHPFFLHEIKIEQYTMIHRSPEEQAQSLKQDMLEVILPAQPLLQQVGATVDVVAFIREYAKLSGKPELNTFVKMQGRDIDYGMSKPDEAAQSQQPFPPERNYNRHSTSSGPAPQTVNQQMIGQMMAAGPQPGAA